MTAKNLYDRDFLKWTIQNARLLRAGKLHEADIEHIAEEIEDMGKSQQRELESRMVVLLAHLLKWRLQTEFRGSSWRSTANTQRREIRRLLRQMPSLRRRLDDGILELYTDAVEAAMDETGLAKKCFPAACPFPLNQILDTTFFPN